MMTSDDKVGGWVKKGQNHDDVIFECPQTEKVCLLFQLLKQRKIRKNNWGKLNWLFGGLM